MKRLTILSVTAALAVILLAAPSASAHSLSVKSIAETGGGEFVSQVTVKVNGVVVASKVGPEETFEAGTGEIEISAPREAFKDIHGVDITDSVDIDPTLIEDDAEERFTAIGISVNELAQTGDPTLYRFKIAADTKVEIKWQQDYALTIEHDFSATESLDSQGNNYAGPLVSGATGTPVPTVKKHWIKRGETEIAQVEGAVVDFSRPGLDIRYVSKSWLGYGPPNRADDGSRKPIAGKGGGITSFTEGADGNSTIITTSAAHGLEVDSEGTPSGRTIVVAGSLPTYNGNHLVTVLDATRFEIPVPFTPHPDGFLVREANSKGEILSLAAARDLLDGAGLLSETSQVLPVVDLWDKVADGNYPGGADFPNGGGNEFAVVATGRITVPTAGDWSFGTNADDGVHLKVGGADVIVDDTRHPPQNRFGTVNLAAGEHEHELELVFFEHGGGAEVELFAAPGDLDTFDAAVFRRIGDTDNGGLAVKASSSRATWSDGGVDIRVGDERYREETPFVVGQDPQRRHIDGFTMDAPGGITYVWQVQYGVRINVDDAARNTLPELYTGIGDGNRVSVGSEQGVYWFDPGTSLTVATEKTERLGDLNDLNGWINGDAFYFSGTAEIDSAGEFETGGVGTDSIGNETAIWNNSITEDTAYLGLEIGALERPVRVLWRYGPPARAVNVTIGQYAFQDDPGSAAMFTVEPSVFTQIFVPDGINVGAADMSAWDPAAGKLYPLVPGVFKADWPTNDSSNPQTIAVFVTASFPQTAHYPHLVGSPPVALDPDPDDNFVFKELRFSESSQAAIDSQNRFTTDQAGKAVLLFSEVQRTGRGEPREFLRVRVVDSQNPGTERDGRARKSAVIGRKITDPELDLARLGTGYLLNQTGDVRYNPFVYNADLLDDLTANAIYDLAALRFTQGKKVVINPGALPGPVIPVNLHPNIDPDTESIIIGWYDDPADNDGLLWPYASRSYTPRWPEAGRSEVTNFSETIRWPLSPTDQMSVTVSGDLAFVAATVEDTLTILDIGDPTQPIQLSVLRDNTGGFNHLDSPTDIAVSGGIAVISSSTEGLTLIDISDPLQPELLKENILGAGTTAVAIAGDTLYAVSAAGLAILDVSDPTQPMILSENADGENGFNQLLGASDIAVDGDLAFITAATDDALTIVDISNPADPEPLSEIVDGQGVFTLLDGAASVAVQEDRVFVAASTDSAFTAIDVSDPSQPVLLSQTADRVATQGSSDPFLQLLGASSISVSEDMVYITSPEDASLTVVDVSDPAAPVEVRALVNGSRLDGVDSLARPSSVAVSGGLAYVTSPADGALTILQVRRDRLGRIIIASQFGSESVNAKGDDQLVAPPINGFPAETTYNPSRLQQVTVYQQQNKEGPGYNPNEEHALMAGSLRFSSVSPRPSAAYALRDGDLNTVTDAGYTSDPFVLVSYFDTADNEFKMNVYSILKEAPLAESTAPRDYRFATGFSSASTSSQLNAKPHVTMEAGEPVIPFYPLGVAIGASPCGESYGNNLKNQVTYWEDHRLTSWAISGGENAWFTSYVFYPLAPDFYWPSDTMTPPIKADKNGATYTGTFDSSRTPFVPRVGDCVAFLPMNVDAASTSGGVPMHLPKPILYKSNWPLVAPVLKAGETLTYQGGEFRADNPTMLVVNDDDELVRVNTPGLPGIVGFASAEVIFDSRNARQTSAGWKSTWTARAVQALDVRQIDLPVGMFPEELTPATKKTTVKGGKYVFNALPASLQKRFRYDPTAGKLEFSGFLNDKDIGEPTLTAAPPAVYVLEPNIMTEDDLGELKNLLKTGTRKAGWDLALEKLFDLGRNPGAGRTEDGQGRLANTDGGAPIRTTTVGGARVSPYLVGLEGEIKRAPTTDDPLMERVGGVDVPQRDDSMAVPLVAFGPGLALVPNADFLDPTKGLPDTSWITIVENNHPSLGGSPVTPHIIKVRKGVDESGRSLRYRGSIKTILSDNVFDENINLQHTGEFGANADKLVFDWWYRPDDGSLNVPPPDLIRPGTPNPWKLFPDPSGKRGLGRFNIKLKGNPNAPEALLADTFWFARYRHVSEAPEDDISWDPYKQGTTLVDKRINFTWAGAGNSQPFEDFDQNGIFDYRAQLAQGWIKRVLDAVNPYEARIRDFEGENPSTVVSMLAQLGPGYEGAVPLNPDKNVIENVGLIELYRTILERGKALSIGLSRPVSTPAIANALQLASTRLADFYTLLGNEAYADAIDQTIGFGSDSVEYGSLAPAVHAFQNQMGSLLEEELALLRGVDDFFARPVYNRLFWNLTKGEGEAAYALNYNLSDVTMDGFVDEDDAMRMFPQGHGDAWGHYLNALRHSYELLNHAEFNWVSRSEFYNLQDIVITVDFLDERKFAQVAAAKAKAGKEIVDNTYRDHYVEDATSQWQGYTDGNDDRAWGVQGWARRAGQGAYFDWVTANALLPSQHPNEELEGIQKVDRTTNSDIAVISANLNSIQTTFDEANQGYNPLNIAGGDTVPFDIDPARTVRGSPVTASHFEQIYERALEALKTANSIWDNANQARNLLRKIGNTEAEFRNKTFQENLSYRNRLLKIFGKPYEGTIGPGNLYPAGYEGPDLALFMYVDVNEITKETVPGPTPSFATFAADDPTTPDVDESLTGLLTGGEIFRAFQNGEGGRSISTIGNNLRTFFSPTFAGGIAAGSDNFSNYTAHEGWFSVDYTDLNTPKVPLDNFEQLMPVTAAGYTFQAPPAWGNRIAAGELQILVNQMIQQEAQIATAIGAWDALTGEIGRTFRIVNSRLQTSKTLRDREETLEQNKTIVFNIIKGLEAARDAIKAGKATTLRLADAGQTAVPTHLPTAGLTFSPGDALSFSRSGIKFVSGSAVSFLDGVEIALKLAQTGAEIGFDIKEFQKLLADNKTNASQNQRELLKELEDLVGDEPVLRIDLFRQIQALKEMSDRYRSLLDEGTRLIDERAAFNKRAAAATQRNRYQDMTFRVSRSHSLQTYRDAFDIAARYAYLAGKAYEYETNLPNNHQGSVAPLLRDIVRTRGLGYLSGGEPAIGKGGISEALAKMKTNYDALEGQLGFNNPQLETGKMSLRTEMLRILPTGDQPDDAPLGTFPSPGELSDDVWKEALRNAVVDDLWQESEFRNLCRPFVARQFGADGTPIPEPGIVLRFSSDITAGNNFFGKPLSGGDHAYDPSNFATKIRSAGIWFSDYRTEDLQEHLADAPRVYLLPTGSDVMNFPNAGEPGQLDDPGLVRMWNVVDQRIPVPLPAVSADLDLINYIPLIDSLNDRFGDPRRFSSFRAYHNSEGDVTEDELVFDSRLIGRSVWNTNWVLIIPGLTLNADAEEGLDRFIRQVSDIKLIFQTYGHSGG